MEHKYVKGSFSRSFFEGDNGYLIGIMKLKETNVEALEDYIGRTLTFTGYFDSLNQTDTYIFYGNEVEHPRFGLQFNVTSYEKIKPTDKLGVISFLSSDLFPGIGEKVATTIVETLGDNALDLILEDNDILKSVPKLNEKKRFTIISNLIKYDESHKVIVTLSDLGLSMKEALSIYSFYQDYTMDKIYENVYELIDTVELPFIKADQVALKLDYSKNDPNRIKATIIYTMFNTVYSNGDTYLTYEDIYINTIKYLNFEIDDEVFKNYLKELSNDKIVIDNNKYYLSNIWQDEEYIIDKLYKLSKPTKSNKNLDEYIETLEKETGILYNDTQKEAIKEAINNNILIITGGPGTGKTTIIKAIVSLYQMINKYKDRELLGHISLLAPTGRASKRMAESCNMPSSTIHHFLKWNKESNSFAVNEYNPDLHDVIIVDEVSMIDIPLFASLLRGTKKDIKLILVGDYNQLPSVGPGELLKDLIDSNKINTIHLDKLYRQDENSYIVTLADEIKNNNLSPNYKETKSDYTFLECSNFMISESLKNIINKLIEKDIINKSQVMAPMYKGENGIDNLNKILQSVINPSNNSKKEIISGDVIYREGDKILQLVNMPDDNVYNGDIGYIVKIENVKGKDILYISFDGNIVEYTKANFNKITHGYVISIHKSQGSEFDTVIIPLTHNYNKMLYRKLIYTAVTRAKRKLILLGEPSSLIKSIENKIDDIRKTDLANKIINMYNND